jgi:hypothetical protein
LQDVRPSDAELHQALSSLAPYIGDNTSHNRSALVAAVHQQRLSQARELLDAFKPPMEALDQLQKEVTSPFLSHPPPSHQHLLCHVTQTPVQVDSIHATLTGMADRLLRSRTDSAQLLQAANELSDRERRLCIRRDALAQLETALSLSLTHRNILCSSVVNDDFFDALDLAHAV